MSDKISSTKLYIMQTNIGLVKIGVSKVVESRLETLQIVSPFQVECAAVVYVLGNSRVVYNIEKSLHHKFKAYNKQFPNKFDGSTEYFSVSVSDVLKALKEFPEVAYADRRERIVYHEDYRGYTSTQEQEEKPIVNLLLDTPVMTVRECSKNFGITLKEAGKLLRENGYIKIDKPLGTKTMKEQRNIYTRLSPQETAKHLQSSGWINEVQKFISVNNYFTWKDLKETLNNYPSSEVKDKDISDYLKNTCGYRSKQTTLNNKRGVYWFHKSAKLK